MKAFLIISLLLHFSNAWSCFRIISKDTIPDLVQNQSRRAYLLNFLVQVAFMVWIGFLLRNL